MSDYREEKKGTKFNLDKLNKENIYQVPDRYFETLPGVIQSRVVEKAPFYNTSVFKIGLRYALPVACILIIGIYFGFFYQKNSTPTFESLMAEVSQQDLVTYLENSDLSIEEIIENIGEEEVALGLEEEAFDLIEDLNLDNENLDDLLEEFDITGEYF